ncbi:MAG: RNA ligase family protein [Cyanobacteria bacterium]|nr:RNA ligase family protein [Cyanobacteriota bacterium]
MNLLKYPRTHHIQGSKLQEGDEDLESIPFSAIAGRNVVVEEKMDGANSAISFDESGAQLLQSRGHYLVGGDREKHFNLFKQWAAVHADALHAVLGSRYICYGEWLFAKHTMFYDNLPHYWLEFDIFDREEEKFLSTPRRSEMLHDLPVVSVSVLFAGELQSYKQLTSMVGKSEFISSDHLESLRLQCSKHSLTEDRVLKETDRSGLMEGLYIKVEEDGVVKGRYKFIRHGFLTSVVESESHWLNRPIMPNLLRKGIDIYSTKESL